MIFGAQIGNFKWPVLNHSTVCKSWSCKTKKIERVDVLHIVPEKTHVPTGKRSSGCGLRGGYAGSGNGTFPHFPCQGYGVANMEVDSKYCQNESSLQDKHSRSFSISTSVRERSYKDIQSQLEEILWELCWTDTQMISYITCIMCILCCRYAPGFSWLFLA